MKIIWKIENFSFLKYENFKSPSFSFENTPLDLELELIIHPNFEKPGGIITIELDGTFNSSNSLNWSFALLNMEGSPFVWEDKEMNSTDDEDITDSVSVSLIYRRLLFGPKKTEYLPDDILTVQCCIWNHVDELGSPEPPIFAQSRIESARVTYNLHFDIPKAPLLEAVVYFARSKTILMKDGELEFVEVAISLSKKNTLKFEFDVSLFRCKMGVKIALLAAENMKQVVLSNQEHKDLGQYETWEFDSGISRNMILSHQNLYFVNNVLTLNLICSFTDYVVIHRVLDDGEIWAIPRPIVALNPPTEVSPPSYKPDIDQPTELASPETISRSLQAVLEEGLMSDCNLRVDGRLFPVHKVILGARSRVFRAMFTTEMTEKRDNFVDIQDVDADTLQRLLRFVYSDEFDEDVEFDGHCRLYAAADKYALESLKEKCSAILKLRICASNALDVLLLADMHHDPDLKSAVLDFISLNDKEVFGSKPWVRFEEENNNLAAETFRNLYFKKMNG